MLKMFFSIPNEIGEHIFSYLTIQDVISFLCSNKQLITRYSNLINTLKDKLNAAKPSSIYWLNSSSPIYIHLSYNAKQTLYFKNQEKYVNEYIEWFVSNTPLNIVSKLFTKTLFSKESVRELESEERIVLRRGLRYASQKFFKSLTMQEFTYIKFRK